MKEKCSDISRRAFLQKLGLGAGSALTAMALDPLHAFAHETDKPILLGDENVQNQMTYRVQHGTGEKISLLGFGMMRLPDEQEEVNRLVDYAIAHGVNYFDTSPMYKRGINETQTGNRAVRCQGIVV